MRLSCPLCGPRDRREFYYMGAVDYLGRPAGDAAPEAWDAYLHLRDNPAGRLRDLWYHEQGCTQWLVVTRDTVTHEIFEVALVMPGEPSGGDTSGRKKPVRKKKGVGDAG